MQQDTRDIDEEKVTDREMQKPDYTPALQKKHNKHRPEISGESIRPHCSTATHPKTTAAAAALASELLDPGDSWIPLDSSQLCLTML